MAQVAGLVVLVALFAALLVLAVRVAQRRRQGSSAPQTSFPRGRSADGGSALDPDGDLPAARPDASGSARAGSAGSVPDAGGGPLHPASVEPASNRAEPPRQRTLPELLAGLAWPSGLVPHVSTGQPDSVAYVALVTSESTAPQVAADLTAELERLGFAVMALSEDELVARRDEDLVSARIHVRARSAAIGGAPLFPTAAPDAVAVEVWAGGGPNPRRS